MLCRYDHAAIVGTFAIRRIDLRETHVRVVDLRRFRVERPERRDDADEHPHRVRVVAEALHHALQVLVQEGVVGDVVLEAAQRVLGRQFAEHEQERRLEVGAVDRQLLDRIAAIAKDPLVAVDEGDGAPHGGGVEKGGVVAHQAELAERGRVERAVLHGHLELGVRTAVGDGERARHRESNLLAGKSWLDSCLARGSAHPQGSRSGFGELRNRREGRAGLYAHSLIGEQRIPQ